jgi:integrase
VYVGRDAVTGGDRYATRTVHAGRREAEGVLNEMVVAAERRSLVKTQATTGELVDAWFEHARRDFSPKTGRETKGYIDRTIKPGRRRHLTAGVDVRTIAGRLGHRNAATALNVYAHVVPEADRRAADLLADLLERER